MKAALLAAGFLLVAASDWELRVEGIPEPICAKSAAVCETARDAIRSGRWDLGLRPDVATECRPRVDCFSSRSECIRNFNCRPNGRSP
jgi:hypothetical protein